MAKGDSIEELTDACEVLVEVSACSKVRDQTIDVQSNYSKLVTTAQGKRTIRNTIQIHIFHFNVLCLE